jgi:hypothetical protein
MATVYLRCDPATYEVFTVEQQATLPVCSGIVTDMKFGKTYNLNDREATYKENGVFVFAVVLACLCDSKLLENRLKARLRTSRSGSGHEYLHLEKLKDFFEVLHARDVLTSLKKTVVDIIHSVTFKHTTHVTFYTASGVLQTPGTPVTVKFTSSSMECNGRESDKIYRSLKRQLEESQERERNLRMRLARYEATEP